MCICANLSKLWFRHHLDMDLYLYHASYRVCVRTWENTVIVVFASMNLLWEKIYIETFSPTNFNFSSSIWVSLDTIPLLFQSPRMEITVGIPPFRHHLTLLVYQQYRRILWDVYTSLHDSNLQKGQNTQFVTIMFSFRTFSNIPLCSG